MADGLEWRERFRGVNVYDVIDQAILVAAADSPQEFIRRRDHIVKRLYTVATAAPTPSHSLARAAAAGEDYSSSARLASENSSKVAVASSTGSPEENEGDGRANDGLLLPGAAPTDVGHGRDGAVNDESLRGTAPGPSGVGHGGDDDGLFDLHTLQKISDEIDEDAQEVNEVLRIKEILTNHKEKSVGILFDSLSRLQLMQLSLDRLESTQIGGAVNALRKHREPDLRRLARALVKGWRDMVDEWVSTTDAIAARDNSGTKPHFSNPFAVEDDRLLTPPMDLGAFFVTHTSSIQHLSGFFDEMDDDGNVISSSDNNDGSGNKSQSTRLRLSNPATLRNQAQGTIIADEMLNADGNALPISADENNVLMRQCFPARQGLALRQKVSQELRSQLMPPRALKKLIPFNAAPEYKPWRVSKETQKKPCVVMEPRSIQGTIAVAGKTPAAAATNPPSGQFNKPLIPAQESLGPRVGMGNRNIQLSEMGIEAARCRLQVAYQEAENAKRQRCVQVVELHDIPKPKPRMSPSTRPKRIDNRTRVWVKGWPK